MYYRQQQPTSVLGAHGYTTEVAGRDRVRFFCRPNATRGNTTAYADVENVHFASTTPATQSPTPGQLAGATFPKRTAVGAGPRTARPHHLPKLRRGVRETFAASRARTMPMGDGGAGGATRDAGIQTVFRENEAQTLPFTPNYYIPEGGNPNPEVLGIQELGWDDGLPAGVEEVELIQRLRRRRALEASLPEGDDAASREARFSALYKLEEQERKEREEHMEKVRQRRLDAIRSVLDERERAREESNRRRLEAVRAQKLKDLRRVVERTEVKRIAAGQKALEEGAPGTSRAAGSGMYAVDPIEPRKRKKDLIELYSKYGVFASEPPIPPSGSKSSVAKPANQFRHYDVRPAMLSLSEGMQEVEKEKVPRLQKLPPNAFVAPENYAITSLPTLYQRREATRVVDALDYVNGKIQKAESQAEKFSVLELYRATPRPQRPDTPELELEDDAEEELEEACVLLQRLIRGRAVQNDFFDGKERCCGLIEELQAASNAKCAEKSPEQKKEEEEAKLREAIADSFGDAAQGDVIVDTLDYLFNELGRQRDLSVLETLRSEAEAVRAEREAKEAELRAQERILHDKEAIQYTAYIRVIDDVVECYTQQLYTTAAEECAMDEAINAECDRLEKLPLPAVSFDAVATETCVCDMLDSFVLPAVVDMVRLKSEELERKAPAAVAADQTKDIVPPEDEKKSA